MALITLIISFILCTTTIFEKEAIEKALRSHILKMGAYSKEHVILEFGSIPEKIEIKAASAKIVISENSISNYRGNITIPVDFISEDKIVSRKYFNLKVRTFDSVYIAGKYLKQNEIIKLSDFERVWMETTNLNSMELSDIAGISGKRITRFLNKGMPLLLNIVDNLPIIEKGKMVKIMVKVNNVFVYSQGIARQDGKAGDKILVENTSSNSVVRAIVKNENVVELIR